MGPIAVGAIAMSISALLYGGYKLNKRRNRRLLREALRKKYAPDLPPLINTQTSRTVIPEDSSNSDDRPPVRRTKQIEELTESEYDEWQERDEQRDANIMQLRLILEDIISELPELEEENDEDLTEDERIMNLDARAEWIVENEDNFDEHATFVETEMVGSGIIVEEAPPENKPITISLSSILYFFGRLMIFFVWAMLVSSG